MVRRCTKEEKKFVQNDEKIPNYDLVEMAEKINMMKREPERRRRR